MKTSEMRKDLKLSWVYKSSTIYSHSTHKKWNCCKPLSSIKLLQRCLWRLNMLALLEGLRLCVNLKWLSFWCFKLVSYEEVGGISFHKKGYYGWVFNASRNKLLSMDEVRSLISLRALILNDNQISSICKLDQLQELNTIVLSRNPICNIRESLVKLKSITKLSLSNCQLQSIGSSLSPLLNLKELRLAHNEIMTLPTELAHNSRLLNLDLGSNSITRYSELKVLSSLHNLRNLNLHGNPVAEKDDIAKKIKKLVPNLQIFNSRPLERGKQNDTSKKARDGGMINEVTDLEEEETKRNKPSNIEKISRKRNCSQKEENPFDKVETLDVERKAKNKSSTINMESTMHVLNGSTDDFQVKKDSDRQRKIKSKKDSDKYRKKAAEEDKIEHVDDEEIHGGKLENETEVGMDNILQITCRSQFFHTARLLGGLKVSVGGFGRIECWCEILLHSSASVQPGDDGFNVHFMEY
ncbi:Leucine-rich repeat (LRR) family protein [Thalictrum thalictroides]|uniref:Leucine-rich repeat (LRR) family protein n=1 Tax=Thalictrum thalictroides TaxID=46969 RepID=A0A7J6WX74_THATH|nr:Leucine-rich repeat (LRR) family protein [Thalictrum thalictroides]